MIDWHWLGEVMKVPICVDIVGFVYIGFKDNISIPKLHMHGIELKGVADSLVSIREHCCGEVRSNLIWGSDYKNLLECLNIEAYVRSARGYSQVGYETRLNDSDRRLSDTERIIDYITECRLAADGW